MVLEDKLPYGVTDETQGVAKQINEMPIPEQPAEQPQEASQIEEKPFYTEYIRVADIVNQQGANALSDNDARVYKEYSDYLDTSGKTPLGIEDQARLAELRSVPFEQLSRPSQCERNQLERRLTPENPQVG